MKKIRLALWISCLFAANASAMKQVAYIYGDVAGDGTIPSGAAAAYDPMLLTDTGATGCSEFRALIEGQGYVITQHYDQVTTLDAAFLEPFDVVVFGLHQKIWSGAEQTALDTWIRAGGGILMYNDSAAGGHFGTVGIGNTTGQQAVNSILSAYGMEVTVDQGGGTRAYTSDPDTCHPVIWDQPVFEGEGVSPVAVDESSGARVLIPLEEAYKVSGGTMTVDPDPAITIMNPRWAVLAHQTVGEGNVMAIFDRQPLWNNGPGSDIDEEDNREVLRRIVRYLARDYGNSPEWLDCTWEWKLKPATPDRYLELSWRQWSGGAGVNGFNYIARNQRFRMEFRTDLLSGGWLSDTGQVELVTLAPEAGGETDRVTVRWLPETDLLLGYARVSVTPFTNVTPLTVDAGMNVCVSESGSAWLEGAVDGTATSLSWSVQSGPGTVTFADGSALETSASFSQPGIYELRLTAINGAGPSSDIVTVDVTADTDVVRAINCGGAAYAGFNGFAYEADTLFTGGHTDTFPGNAVAKTADDALYNFARSNHSSYDVPVANGTYKVYLQFSETFFGGENSRVFSASLEGNPIIQDLDLVEAAPGKWVAYDLSFPATVNDGALNITFSSTVNNALLNALVVIQD
ncbi:MAG: DUF4350 domain-containing protein [Verrucomicrobiota bacterium]